MDAAPSILIVSGISGSGKGTICAKLKEKHELSLPISVTTRKPRAGERFADHYYFVSKELFAWLVDTKQLLEHVEMWGGHNYGTLAYSVETAVKQGKRVLFEIETYGVQQILAKFPHAKVVFVKAPSETEQRLRLELRGTVGTEQDERVAGAEKELAVAESLGLPIIINNDLGKALSEIEAVFELN